MRCPFVYFIQIYIYLNITLSTMPIFIYVEDYVEQQQKQNAPTTQFESSHPTFLQAVSVEQPGPAVQTDHSLLNDLPAQARV